MIHSRELAAHKWLEIHGRSLYPILRANPFPEVTDLFCRLPLSTLFYRPEAANLGDLMRFMVRPGEQIILLLRFSRIVSNAPDIAKNAMLCLIWGPISG
jgi:hypothetical protein